MKKTVKTVIIHIFIVFCVVMLYILATKLPMQKLNITAKTTAEEFDLSDSVRFFCFDTSKEGDTCTAIIKFMAVPDTSENLFTHFGIGQYVYLGCKELQAECNFISFGRFLNVRLTLNAAQTDLKLEDGTPFDSTRYSLQPVISIGE